MIGLCGVLCTWQAAWQNRILIGRSIMTGLWSDGSQSFLVGVSGCFQLTPGSHVASMARIKRWLVHTIYEANSSYMPRVKFGFWTDCLNWFSIEVSGRLHLARGRHVSDTCHIFTGRSMWIRLLIGRFRGLLISTHTHTRTHTMINTINTALVL